MRLASLLCFVIATLSVAPAEAAQEFFCGGSKVGIRVVTRHSVPLEERAEAVVTVSRNGADTVLRFQSVDFTGGKCVDEHSSRPLVVFQAYCGGSICRDLENWGVIDPNTLRVLAVPNDTSRAEVQEIVGPTKLPKLEVLSVTEEARNQGVSVP